MTGHLEADLQLQRSLMHPEVGGAMRFSRGVAYLNPQGPSPAGQSSAEAGAQEADLVAQAFSALQARKEGPSGTPTVRQQSRLEALQQVYPRSTNSTHTHSWTIQIPVFAVSVFLAFQDRAKLLQPCDNYRVQSAAYRCHCELVIG